MPVLIVVLGVVMLLLLITVMETIIGVVGLADVLLLNVFI